MKKVFSFLGKFFKDVWTKFMIQGKAAYDALPEDQKIAFSKGSGLVAVLNDTIGKTPAEVRTAIMTKLPNIDVAKMEVGLFTLAKQFGLTGYSNLDECITVIQDHLSALKGKEWELASHAAACILTIIFGPDNLKVSAVASLMEIVYTYVIAPMFAK
jgi:hypothetical protein